MRKLSLGAPPANATLEQKVEHLQSQMRLIGQASHDIDAFDIADKFTFTNLTEDRVLDANTGVLANLAAAEAAINETRDVLLTFIKDMKNRGAKRV